MRLELLSYGGAQRQQWYPYEGEKIENVMESMCKASATYILNSEHVMEQELLCLFYNVLHPMLEQKYSKHISHKREFHQKLPKLAIIE